MEYSFDCKIRKLSAKTIENYQKQLRYLQRYLEQEYGVKEVEEVRAYQIKEFLAMMDDKQRKPRYINDLLKVFRTFFNYLKKEGHIARDDFERYLSHRGIEAPTRKTFYDDV